MRILTVANHLGARGGLERTQLTNCAALAARGHRVDLVFVTAGDFAEDWRRITGSMVQIRGSLPNRRRPFTSTRALVPALRSALRLRPDVVYVYRYWDLPYAAALGLMARAPLVFHLCLPPPRMVPRWLRICLRRVAVTLAVSRDTAARWAGTGLRPDRTTVVLTGVDLSRYTPAAPDERAATRRALGVPEDGFLVLYAGRIGREKGVDVLVQAFGAVRRVPPTCGSWWWDPRRSAPIPRTRPATNGSCATRRIAYRCRGSRLAPTSSASSRPPTWRWPRACGPSHCPVR